MEEGVPQAAIELMREVGDGMEEKHEEQQREQGQREVLVAIADHHNWNCYKYTKQQMDK
jgi:hypothetical protein